MLLIFWSSSDGRCDKLWSCGHCCAHRQLKRAFVSWSFVSSGWEPGSNGKGRKSNQPSCSWLSGPGNKGVRDTSQNLKTVPSPHLSRYHCEHLPLCRARKCFLSYKNKNKNKKTTLLYYLLLLLLLLLVLTGRGGKIANSFSNGQKEIMRNAPCQKPK